jgi:hypothetical protein
MSLFHKLQDVYFDAVNLGEELKQIPPSCDCCDAVAHLAGRGYCADVLTKIGRVKRRQTPVCIGVPGVFAASAYEDMFGAGVAEIVTCNTIKHPTNVIDVSSHLVEAIRKIF